MRYMHVHDGQNLRWEIFATMAEGTGVVFVQRTYVFRDEANRDFMYTMIEPYSTAMVLP